MKIKHLNGAYFRAISYLFGNDTKIENVSKRQNTLWKFAALLLCKVLENKVSIQ